MDVSIFQTNDGGEIRVESGGLTIDDGLQSAVYLSLFGGNDDDDGRPGNTAQYWANYIEQDPDRQQRSRTQYLIRSTPATTYNLARLEDAARQDLDWLDANVSVSAALETVNRVRFEISIERIKLFFHVNWGAMS